MQYFSRLKLYDLLIFLFIVVATVLGVNFLLLQQVSAVDPAIPRDGNNTPNYQLKLPPRLWLHQTPTSGSNQNQHRWCRYDPGDSSIYGAATNRYLSQANNTTQEVNTLVNPDNQVNLRFNIFGHHCTSKMSRPDIGVNCANAVFQGSPGLLTGEGNLNHDMTNRRLCSTSILNTRINEVGVRAVDSNGNTIPGVSARWNQTSGNLNNINFDWTGTYGTSAQTDGFYAMPGPGNPIRGAEFRIDGLSNINEDTDVYIQVTGKFVTTFDDNGTDVYQCIHFNGTNSSTTLGGTAGSPGTVTCNNNTMEAKIRISQPTPPPPEGSIVANCNQVIASATLAGGGQYGARLFINGNEISGADGGLRTAQSGQDVIFDVSPWGDLYRTEFQVRFRRIGDFTETTFSEAVTLPNPCARLQCSSVAVGGNKQPGEEFNVTPSVRIENFGPQGRAFSYRFIVGFVQPGTTDQYVTVRNSVFTGNEQRHESGLVSGVSQTISDSEMVINDVGEYDVRFRMQYGRNLEPANVMRFPSGEIPCPGDLEVSFQPYVKFYGHDVIAGGRFGREDNGSCSPFENAASIKTYDDILPDSAGGGVVASSTQFAAFALGSIEKFHTAGMRHGSGSMPNKVSDLSFGNFGPSGRLSARDRRGADPQPYPGDSGISRCTPDYFDQAAQQGLAPDNATTVNAAALSGDRLINPNNSRGRLVIRGGEVTGNVTLYVDGDVLIQDNITLSAFSNAEEIPSFVLISTGNIYIDRARTPGGFNTTSGVDRLDGVYIAQGASLSEGNIYTCSNLAELNLAAGGALLYTSNSLHNQCSERSLTVNGAFIAQKVHFLRTRGTIGDARPNDSPGDGQAAETFNFLPELYINPYRRGEAENAVPKYDSILSLPPIL